MPRLTSALNRPPAVASGQRTGLHSAWRRCDPGGPGQDENGNEGRNPAGSLTISLRFARLPRAWLSVLAKSPKYPAMPRARSASVLAEAVGLVPALSRHSHRRRTHQPFLKVGSEPRLARNPVEADEGRA
jgi:hypothetical protein